VIQSCTRALTVAVVTVILLAALPSEARSEAPPALQHLLDRQVLVITLQDRLAVVQEYTTIGTGLPRAFHFHANPSVQMRSSAGVIGRARLTVTIVAVDAATAIACPPVLQADAAGHVIEKGLVMQNG
jgi:hypothetical protein